MRIRLLDSRALRMDMQNTPLFMQNVPMSCAMSGGLWESVGRYSGNGSRRNCLRKKAVFTYEVEGRQIEKTVFMAQGENTTVIQYEIKRRLAPLPENIELELRPLIVFRDYHSLTHENGALKAAVEAKPGSVGVSPYEGLPSLHLAHNADQLGAGSNWSRNVEYDAERERGLDLVEDLFNPCVLRFAVLGGYSPYSDSLR